MGGDKVVLRARVQLRLLGLIPAGVGLFLSALPENSVPECLRSTVLHIDLFEPSTGPKYWRRALELEGQGYGVTQIGKKLGITKRAGCLARDYGRMMQQRGLDDPFVELTEAPDKASRWRGRQSRSRTIPEPVIGPAAEESTQVAPDPASEV